MFWYLRNQRSKQTNLADLQFLLNYPFFFPKVVRKGKKNLEYESILYNSTELLDDWTFREFQSQTILFSRKIKSSI